MVHISPWRATLNLLSGASRILPVGGPLYLHGPYIHPDRPLVASNILFDADLRARNPEWGLRHLDDVTHEASLVGLRRERIIDMPANNLSIVLPKSDAAVVLHAPSANKRRCGLGDFQMSRKP